MNKINGIFGKGRLTNISVIVVNTDLRILNLV